MYSVIIDFTYETKFGTRLTGQMESLDYDESGNLISAILSWCEENGFKMKKIEMTRIDKED